MAIALNLLDAHDRVVRSGGSGAHVENYQVRNENQTGRLSVCRSANSSGIIKMAKTPPPVFDRL
jgi:hypothetical protein